MLAGLPATSRGDQPHDPHRPDANMCSMTSQGSAITRFDRAVRTGNPNIVIAAAHEFPRPVLLRDALRVLLVLAAAAPDRYPPAAARFGARLVGRAKAVGRRRAETARGFGSGRSDLTTALALPRCLPAFLQSRAAGDTSDRSASRRSPITDQLRVEAAGPVPRHVDLHRRLSVSTGLRPDAVRGG